MNYIIAPKLYNTGYLLDDTESRLKQGLMPQDLASDCFNSVPNFSKNIYCKNCYTFDNPRLNGSKSNINAFKLAQMSTQNKVVGPYINRNLMYPIHNFDVNYCLPKIPNDCPCTDYIQSP